MFTYLCHSRFITLLLGISFSFACEKADSERLKEQKQQFSHKNSKQLILRVSSEIHSKDAFSFKFVRPAYRLSPTEDTIVTAKITNLATYPVEVSFSKQISEPALLISDCFCEQNYRLEAKQTREVYLTVRSLPNFKIENDIIYSVFAAMVTRATAVAIKP